jgi:hypothetical protein
MIETGLSPVFSIRRLTVAGCEGSGTVGLLRLSSMRPSAIATQGDASAVVVTYIAAGNVRLRFDTLFSLLFEVFNKLRMTRAGNMRLF